MSLTLTVCRRLSQGSSTFGKLRIFSPSRSSAGGSLSHIPVGLKGLSSDTGGFRIKRELPAELKSRLGQLVYSGPQNTTVLLVKSFSLSTSLVAVCLQPIIWSKYLAEVDSAAALLYIITTMTLSAVMLGTPFLLHILTKRYVKELYYDAEKDQWTAVVYNIFVRETTVQFRSNQIQTAVGAFATVVADGRPLLIAPQLIQNVDIKTKLLGYDKDIEI